MLLQPLPFTLGMFVLAAAASISLLSIDIWLLGVASLVFPATWIANRIFTQKVIAPASKVRKAVGDVTAVVHESLDGALVVKTLGREADEVQRLTQSADRLRKTRTQIGRLRATFEPTLDTLPSLGMVAVLAIGAWRISDGNVTTGQVIQAMILFQQLAFPIRIIGFFLEENAMSVVAARRLKKAFKVNTPLQATGTETLGEGPLAIEFNNVTYRYGNQTVLEGCSFQIDTGEIVALVGETGAGKTTIAQLLFGLIEPHHGSITVGNYQLPEINPQTLRERISLVSQETFLFADHLTQNVKLYREIDNRELDKHAKTAQVDFVNEMPDRWGTLVGERGVTLSGGQRQRIAITRALVGDPGFLMLDDSTSAIDPILEGEILEALRKNLSTTTLVVAHRLSTIKLAKRVLFLHQGSIVASGSHEELLKNSDYADLVKAYERDAK
ncbi:MAG: ABC transporter ATP-binding protein [Actinomycetota bacterium]|nr:ABC transporter ATP-binding protein [Actinomycetota bacterium]